MENNKKFNLFKLLQNVALIGLFLVIGLGTLFATNMLPRTLTSLEITIILGLLLAGVLLILPWAKYLEQKEYRVVSLIFLIANAICTALWVISTIIICGAISKDTGDAWILQLVRITLIISFQVIIASFIGKFIIKYRAKYIPFQAITYLSLLYIDFWLSALLMGIKITLDKITFSPAYQSLLFNQGTVSILILALVYLGASLGIINGSRRRRVRNSILARNRIVNRDIGIMDLNDDDDEVDNSKNSANDTEKQLEKIKSMFDKGLITKEEYDAKRQSIIDKM